MPSASFSDYVRVMLALPGTTNQIAKRTGMYPGALRQLLRRFWQLKLLHPGRVELMGEHNTVAPVWLAGDGPRTPELRKETLPLQPYAMQIGFATVWRALADGATVPAVEVDTGMSRAAVYRMLAALEGRVYVSGWEHDSLGRPVAVWTLGQKRSVDKPLPPTPGEKFRRYHQRLAHRALSGFSHKAAA